MENLLEKYRNQLVPEVVDKEEFDRLMNLNKTNKSSGELLFAMLYCYESKVAITIRFVKLL